MKEFKTILAEYKKLDLTRRKAALATVVKVRGSAYRSPGARMLITDDGRWVGSISGGCLEGDALRKARQVMNDQVPMTVTYDTREESNQNLGIGLGCNGVIDVLIEPIRPDNDPTLSVIKKIVKTQNPVAMATVFSGHALIGRKMLLDESKVPIEFDGTLVSPELEKALAKVFESQRSEAKTISVECNDYEVFFELVQPNVSLIICGGGFDARPVSQLAKSLGWEVTVTDECVAHIAPAFFPDADKLSLCDRTFIDRDFHTTPYTACVLMSHNYEYDRDVLRKLLPGSSPYIGILGPRKRYDKMLAEFDEAGIKVDAEMKSRIHSPIGLDIGAETPDEIAVSIIAEIQSRFSRCSGGFLKYRNGPIHQRDIHGGQVFKQVYLGSSVRRAGS